MSAAPFRLAASAALALLGAGAAGADTISPQVDRWRAGVVCPSTFPSGRLTANLPFIAETTIVPAVQGFGFGVEAKGVTDIAGVTVTVTHPPINGSMSNSYNSRISGEALSAFYFRLETAAEVAPGQWNITASANGTVIYSVDFEVKVPAPGDGLLRACGL